MYHVQVVSLLQRLPIYTEFMERSTEVKGTEEQHVWQLTRDRMPYPGHDLVLPRGIRGQLHIQNGMDRLAHILIINKRYCLTYY